MSAAWTLQPISSHRRGLDRARRKAGLRCLTLQVREAEIVALVRKGLLRPASQHDITAVRAAHDALLDRHLGGGM